MDTDISTTTHDKILVFLQKHAPKFSKDMFDFMDHVLEKENCPFKLYEFSAQMQFVIMLYCSETQQEKIAPLIDEF